MSWVGSHLIRSSLEVRFACLFGIWKNLRFLLYAVSPAGCQAPLLGKQQWQVLLALEGGSGEAQVPAAWSPLCAEASPSPSRTAVESVPPNSTQKHCNKTKKIFHSEWKREALLMVVLGGGLIRIMKLDLSKVRRTLWLCHFWWYRRHSPWEELQTGSRISGFLCQGLGLKEGQELSPPSSGEG